MTDDIHQELLSAYLDGELTSEEQTQVEQLLAENPEYRQLYDELRALRSSLELLPRFRLNDDIGRTVMRKAERTVLGGQRNGSHGSQESGVRDHSSPSGASAAKADEAPAKVERQWRIPSGRAVLYPALALAACLLIMFFSNAGQKPGDDVALGPDVKPNGLGPNKVEADTLPGKAPAVVPDAGVRSGDNNPPAVPDPRAIVGTARGSHVPNVPVDPAVVGPGVGTVTTVDADLDKTPLERSLKFANELNKPLAGALLILRCQASQEALDGNAIDVILARHDLKISPAGEKLGDGEKSEDLPKVATELDLIYVETTALKLSLILAEIEAEKQNFPSFKYEMPSDVEANANRISQGPQLSPAQLEEARGTAARNAEQGPKVGNPAEKQTAGEDKPADQKVANGTVQLEPWSARAHRLRLGTAKEKEKTAVIARKQAAPTEPVLRLLIVIRSVGTLADKK